MVQHTVCFKLADSSDASKEEVRRLLLSMEGKVPSARSISVGVDRLCSERSYDILLQVLVDDWDALEVYQADPYHCGTVKAYLRDHAVSTIALDCEV